MKLLIAYATTEGQTRKIAAYLSGEAKIKQQEVIVCDVTEVMPDPAGYDMVLVAASMHIERYQTAAAHYIRKYHKQLSAMHSAFISVSLTAAGDDEEAWAELKQVTNHFLDACRWKTRVEYVAGALRYTQYDFFKKYMLRSIAKKNGGSTDTTHDTEYTDWKKLSGFLNDFIQTWVPRPVQVAEVEDDTDSIG